MDKGGMREGAGRKPLATPHKGKQVLLKEEEWEALADMALEDGYTSVNTWVAAKLRQILRERK